MVASQKINVPKLDIHHRTTHQYQNPASPSPHRLLLRTRESRELGLISHDLSISPEAALNWAQDVFGNAVATASFRNPTDSLVIDSKVGHIAPWPNGGNIRCQSVAHTRHSISTALKSVRHLDSASLIRKTLLECGCNRTDIRQLNRVLTHKVVSQCQCKTSWRRLFVQVGSDVLVTGGVTTSPMVSSRS